MLNDDALFAFRYVFACVHSKSACSMSDLCFFGGSSFEMPDTDEGQKSVANVINVRVSFPKSLYSHSCLIRLCP